ncbi:PaaI family thioesterase [Pyruvatibacter mobilis]|uniref:PaaI family thioesterase n=1 Tax=Pyruvatibacter mobilis TaxID=1712261 RepID=UPI003BAD6E5C
MTQIPDGWTPIHTFEYDTFEKLAGPIYKPQQKTEGEQRYGFLVEKRHCNPYGMLHGGMLSTVADTLLGSVVYHATGGVPIATIYLNTEFIGAAREGDWVEGVATLRKKGRRVVFTQGEFHVGDKLIASSAGAWAIIGA